MLNTKKVSLIYGFSNDEIQMIKDKLKEYNLPNCKEINSSMAKMKIKNIVEGLKFETINEKLPKEKTVIFNNLNDEELNASINLMRNMFKEQPIFAVVTENSNEWTFEDLLEHLIQEREWHRKNSMH